MQYPCTNSTGKITHTVTGHTPHFIHHYWSRDHRQPQATGIQVAQEFTRCMEHLSPAQGLESALARVWLYRWAPLRQRVLYLNWMVPVSPAWTTGSLPRIEVHAGQNMHNLLIWKGLVDQLWAAFGDTNVIFHPYVSVRTWKRCFERPNAAMNASSLITWLSGAWSESS